jgi:hypothetical protein
MASIISFGERVTDQRYPNTDTAQEMAEWWRKVALHAVPAVIGSITVRAAEAVRDFFEDASDPRNRSEYTEPEGEK